MRMSLTQSMTLGLRRRRCVVVDAKLTLGAGDAFLAGFVRGWLASESLEQCKRLGNAMGALVASRRGCAPAMPTRVELDACLARAHTSHRIDRDPEVEFLHRATTRSTRWSELHVLALDHRWQLEELVDSVGASRARISRLKTLVAEGAIRGANASGARQLGMIVDDTFGGDVLAALRDRGIWLARPIEASGRVPLAFDDELNVELALRGRPPSEIVKCLVQSAEDMSATDRAVQNRRLRRLYGACVDLERSLVVEAMPTAAGRIDARRISTMVEEIYALGIRPDWWKLPAPDDAAGFDAVSRIVEAHDPHCCGILILGYDASLDALRAAFRASAGWRHFNGFAVGRAIFWDAAVAWFAGNLGDDGVIGGLDSLRFARRRLAVAGRGRAMTRLRLTMAEALVRHLAAQHVGDRWPYGATLWRRLCDLRARQCLGSRTCPRRHGSFPTYRAQRAGDGARGNRVRQSLEATSHHGLHDIDRAGCNEPRDRGCDRARESDPGAPSSRRYVCEPCTPIRPAAARGFRRSIVHGERCLRPVSRYFDRVVSARQLVSTLPRAIATLVDPAQSGPRYARASTRMSNARRGITQRLFPNDGTPSKTLGGRPRQLDDATSILRASKMPMIIAGGGVHYSDACHALASFARTPRSRRGDSGGKERARLRPSCACRRDRRYGHVVGETRSLVTRTSSSRSVRDSPFHDRIAHVVPNPSVEIVGVNVSRHDAQKHGSRPLVGDAKQVLGARIGSVAGAVPTHGGRACKVKSAPGRSRPMPRVPLARVRMRPMRKWWAQ